MSDEASRVPYKNPGRLPREQRIGLTVEEPGQPFEHFCMVCGEWGGWGFNIPGKPEIKPRWYCGQHKDQGQAWHKALTKA